MPEKTSHIQQETQAFKEMASRLGPEGMAMLDVQLETWNDLKDRPLESPLRNSFRDGSTLLPKGTLLHRVAKAVFNPEVAASVKELGLVSGDLRGISEDGETYGCVDFFKPTEDITIEEYFKSVVNPSRHEKLFARGVVLIVDPEAEGMDQLMIMDGYRNPGMANFINRLGDRTEDDTSAILGAVPPGAIAGAVISDGILNRPELVQSLRDSFPDLPLFNQRGELQASQMTQ